jgi:hypothetical protein
MARITGTLYEEQYALLIYRSVLYRMKSVSDKRRTENKKKNYAQLLFLVENFALYEIM